MSKPTLTDAQRVVLAAAGARETGLLLPLPKSLKKPRVVLDDLLRDLLAKGLVEVRSAQDGEAIWSSTETEGRTTLVISPAGLAEVGIADQTVLEGKTEPAAAPKMSGTKRAAGKKPASKKPAESALPATSRKPNASPSKPTTRVPTKLERLVNALRQKQGATIPELMEMTGWQAHSVRGAISGSLKKKQNLNVTSKPVEGRGRVYRIEAGSTK